MFQPSFLYILCYIFHPYECLLSLFLYICIPTLFRSDLFSVYLETFSSYMFSKAQPFGDESNFSTRLSPETERMEFRMQLGKFDNFANFKLSRHTYCIDLIDFFFDKHPNTYHHTQSL